MALDIKVLAERVAALEDEGLAARVLALLEGKPAEDNGGGEADNMALAALAARLEKLEGQANATAQTATELSETIRKDAAQGAISLALREGKILPTQVEAYTGLYLKDPESFALVLKDAPRVGPREGEVGFSGASQETKGTVALTEVDKATARALGLSEKQMLAEKRADAGLAPEE